MALANGQFSMTAIDGGGSTTPSSTLTLGASSSKSNAITPIAADGTSGIKITLPASSVPKTSLPVVSSPSTNNVKQETDSSGGRGGGRYGQGSTDRYGLSSSTNSTSNNATSSSQPSSTSISSTLNSARQLIIDAVGEATPIAISLLSTYLSNHSGVKAAEAANFVLRQLEAMNNRQISNSTVDNTQQEDTELPSSDVLNEGTMDEHPVPSRKTGKQNSHRRTSNSYGNKGKASQQGGGTAFSMNKRRKRKRGTVI